MKLWWLAYCIISLHSQVGSCHERQQHRTMDATINQHQQQIDKWKKNNQALIGDSIHYWHASSTFIVDKILNYQRHTTYRTNNKQRVIKIWWLAHFIISLHSQLEFCHEQEDRQRIQIRVPSTTCNLGSRHYNMHTTACNKIEQTTINHWG
jgi:hypothetical protein